MSAPDATGAYVHVEPRLMEEATFLALRGRPEILIFDRERTRLYAIPDDDEREARFRALYAAWFARLDLARPLLQALEEQPAVRAGTRACVIGGAVRPADEGVDLHVAAGPAALRSAREDSTLVVRLRPESFAAAGRLLIFLRHELQHVADILDPRFGYEPRLPMDDPDPARHRLVLDRYSALWDVCVDGRLSRQGRALEGAEALRRREFERIFRGLGGRCRQVFEHFWNHPSPTHAELAAVARDPESALRAALTA